MSQLKLRATNHDALHWSTRVDRFLEWVMTDDTDHVVQGVLRAVQTMPGILDKW